MAKSQPGASSMWASTSEGPGRGNEPVLQGSKQKQGWEVHFPANISKIRGVRGKGHKRANLEAERPPSYHSLLSHM